MSRFQKTDDSQQHGFRTKQQLIKMYQNTEMVEDLCQRKIHAGHVIANPEMPDREDSRLYWCLLDTSAKEINSSKTEETFRLQAREAPCFCSSLIVACLLPGLCASLLVACGEGESRRGRSRCRRGRLPRP